MARRGRSARGDTIDFDLIAIKQQLADAPSSVDVHARRTYIDNKEGVSKKALAETAEDVRPSIDEFSGNDEPLPEGFSVEVEDSAPGDPFDLVNV